MALTLPLHVAASVQRCCSNRAGTSSFADEIIELIVNRSSLFDIIKWQQISKGFQRATQKRLDMYTMIDIKVYNGLKQLRHKAGAESEYDWHPSLALMIMELEPNHLGIAIDSELKASNVTALLHLLFTLRRKVEQLFIDSPIIELLVAQINKEQINMLIEMVSLSRKMNRNATRGRQLKLTPLHRIYFPDVPFFPNLKKLSITSKANQLQHLSRLLGYAVSVDLLYHVEQMDLLCLKILVGNVWIRPTKFRLFRHLTRFRQWTEANMLGERYFQQFGTTRKRSRSLSYCLK
uniref:FBD domain-containing protein n=1 Tax=Setaria digitata TaxID=48799 RepID=A0A915Q2F0_9BILA